ncbi:hypothetical protein [Umezawaea sp. Da 62-37]|uniref:hypothetical protein n=1 Tax=Umezawaea sp. Da 62-37 TaxID=3075927 RepID=UPI0028F6E723|nr:hypothetical protein [Umezawaea sp. Da 62-37]WNV83829.1 hypothetical protein RM788_37495 [Umezawaea sp. Da 62-37]
MTVLIFLIGALLGVLIGAVACVRYVRQEMTARVAPSMHLMEARMSTLQSSVDLALSKWHEDMHTHRIRHDRVLD